MYRRLFAPILLVGLLALSPVSSASHQEGRVDLRVTQADAPDPVVEGGYVTYTIDVANVGVHPADRVELTHVVPGAAIVAASGRKWECAAPQGTSVTCALHGALPEGSSTAPVTVVAQAPVDGPSALTATATGTSRGVEQKPFDNVAHATTSIAQGTHLTVSMFDNPDPVTALANVAYGISVTNNGDVVAEQVTVDHQVSAGQGVEWFTLDENGDGVPEEGWTCTQTGTSASCSFAHDLPVGGGTPKVYILVEAPDTGTETQIQAVASAGAANVVAPADVEQETTVEPPSDSATGFISPDGGCLTTNPNRKCTVVPGQGLDALSATVDAPDSGATLDNNTFGDVRFGPGTGGVASLFEGSAKLAVCTAVDPIDPADCAGAFLDVVVPPGYDNPADPIEVNLVYDVSVAPTIEDPRRVYMEKLVAGQPVTTILTECSLLGVASPSPCVDFQTRIAGDDLLIRILMLSQDPKYQG